MDFAQFDFDVLHAWYNQSFPNQIGAGVARFPLISFIFVCTFVYFEDIYNGDVG